MLLSLAVTLVTLTIAATVGCFLARQRFSGRSTLLALLTFPLAFPGVVVGFLVVMLAGRQGLLAQISGAVSRALDAGLFVYRPVYWLSLFSLPRAIITLVAASENSTVLEEAARSLGASQWRITGMIVPGLQPALLSTGALFCHQHGCLRYCVYPHRSGGAAADHLRRIHQLRQFRHRRRAVGGDGRRRWH